MKQPVTKGFVAINVLIHIYVWLYVGHTQGLEASIAIVDRFGLTPSEFWNGAIWQPITALFLHDGQAFPVMHIMFNMLGIWSFGMILENTLGSPRFAWLLFVAGCTSSLFVVLFQPEAQGPTIGASGIVLGLLGALAVFYPNSPLLVFFIPMKARTAAIAIAALSLFFQVFGILTFISHMGHLGGLAGGFLGAILYSRYALGLRPGESELRDYDSYLRRKMAEQEALREMMERMQRFTGQRRSSEERWRPVDDTPHERVINPRPEDEPAEGKRLYYDPITGRLYTR